jgi:hypothetical protein
LQEQAAVLAQRQLGVAAISYDSVPILKDFSTRRKISVPLLSDQDSKLIRQLGILNTSIPAGRFGHGVPHPMTVWLDANGAVTKVFADPEYTERVTAASIVTREFGLDGRAHGVTKTDHLTLDNSSSATKARPGQRISLVMKAMLKPKMHVYAPKVTGYIPVSFKMDESPYFKAEEITFPAARVLLLPAIKEKVPVYLGSFRVLQELTFADGKTLKPLLEQKEPIKVTGKFRYQACDDKVCYLPKEVSVEWQFDVEPLDVERVAPELRHK